MKRKMMILSVTALLLLNTVTFSLADTAQEQTTTGSQETTTPQTGTVQLPDTLTLEKAYEIALENNISIRKAEMTYDQAVWELKQAKEKARDIDEDAVKTDLQSAQSKYVTTEQKEMAEVIAKQTYEIEQQQLKNEVEQGYYNVLKAEKLVASRDSSFKISEEQLKIVQNKFKAGTAVKTDVNRAEINLSSAKINLLNAQRDLKTSQVNFNKILCVDVNNETKFSMTLDFVKVTIPTLEALTAQALESRIDLQKARNSVKINQMSYDLVVGFSAPNTYSARNSKNQLESSKLDLYQTEQNVKADVLNTLFQMQKAEEAVALSAKNLEQAKENQSLAQRRYEIGVGTFVDALSATAELEDSESNYIETIYSYNLAKNELKNVVVTN